MKTTYIKYLILAVISSFALCGCSDDDEKLTPSAGYPNFFLPADTDNSQEAVLRRDFYKNTGIYLVFNDTLATYTDDYGIEKTETLDVGWSITSYLPTYPEWDYIETFAEREAAIKSLDKYFIPYLTVEGSPLRPFCLFPVRNLLSPDKWGNLKPSSYFSGLRCLMIDVSDWLEADESEMPALARSLLKDVISAKVTETSEEVMPFLAVGGNLYDSTPYKEFADWMDFQDITLIYEAGFLRYFPDSWGDPDWDQFPNRGNDIKDYLNAVFNENESEFREKWAEYPKIIEKYEIMKQCIEAFGIKF